MDNSQMFQLFLEDQCWTCKREPSCAKMVDLKKTGKAESVELTEKGYKCREYKRDYGMLEELRRARGKR